MNRLNVEIIILDKNPIYIREIVKSAESGEEAITFALRKVSDHLPRPLEVGDCAIVNSLSRTFVGYYIFDRNMEPVSVSNHELEFWVANMAGNPTKKHGIRSAAREIIAHLHHTEGNNHANH
jgi:hypothetical protein